MSEKLIIIDGVFTEFETTSKDKPIILKGVIAEFEKMNINGPSRVYGMEDTIYNKKDYDTHVKNF